MNEKCPSCPLQLHILAMDKALDQLFGADPADETTTRNERGVMFIKNRTEAPGFPKGWYREEVIRSGASVMHPAQRIIFYYRSASGDTKVLFAQTIPMFAVQTDGSFNQKLIWHGFLAPALTWPTSTLNLGNFYPIIPQLELKNQAIWKLDLWQEMELPAIWALPICKDSWSPLLGSVLVSIIKRWKLLKHAGKMFARNSRIFLKSLEWQFPGTSSRNQSR